MKYCYSACIKKPKKNDGTNFNNRYVKTKKNNKNTNLLSD